MWFPLGLLGLLTLPALWWLLRVTPPRPRTQTFSALRLLRGLTGPETPAQTPWWLLLLRLATAALVILGLSGPVLGERGALPGSGPLLLVLDDGWAAAPDFPPGWPARPGSWTGRLEKVGRWRC